MDYGGTVTVNQPLITNGNIYWETSLNSYDDLYNDDRSSTFNTRLRLRQPIDALYGYNAIRSSLKSAKLDYERTNKSLRREELNLVYRVSSAYYNLLSLQRSTEIALLDYERQNEANLIAQNKYASGLIREVDALQMEVDLAEAQNSYEMALINQESAVNSFKELLGIELSDSVVLNDELKYNIIVVDAEKAVEYALKNRTELRDQDIAIEQQEMSIRQRKADGMVRGYFDAYVQKTGTSMNDLSTAYGSVIQTSANDFMNRPINYGVGLTVSVPILDWGENKARVRAAEARQRQNYLAKEELERSIETETRNSVAQLNNNLKRLQLLEKNVLIAEKSFDITLQRFSDGDIDSQTLALERNRLNSAYRNHLSAYIAYQLSLADIMRKTLYDFEKGEPLAI
jgi:outer membrane protein TolC